MQFKGLFLKCSHEAPISGCSLLWQIHATILFSPHWIEHSDSVQNRDIFNICNLNTLFRNVHTKSRYPDAHSYGKFRQTSLFSPKTLCSCFQGSGKIFPSLFAENLAQLGVQLSLLCFGRLSFGRFSFRGHLLSYDVALAALLPTLLCPNWGLCRYTFCHLH